jgi:hypothetical protein
MNRLQAAEGTSIKEEKGKPKSIKREQVWNGLYPVVTAASDAGKASNCIQRKFVYYGKTFKPLDTAVRAGSTVATKWFCVLLGIFKYKMKELLPPSTGQMYLLVLSTSNKLHFVMY